MESIKKYPTSKLHISSLIFNSVMNKINVLTKDELIMVSLLFKAYHKINEERKKYLTELDEVSVVLSTVFIQVPLFCSG